MISLSNYIIEKFKINSNTISHDEIDLSQFTKVEINNDVDCKALPKEYVDAIIWAFLKSPLKKDVIKIDVTDAQSFFDNNPDGQDEFKRNKINYGYLYNRHYPAMTVTYQGNNSRTGLVKLDTLMKRMPSIHMPLILNDSEGLYTKKNSINMTGVRDVDNSYLAFNGTSKFAGGVTEYRLTIIYIVKPKATDKLLPIDIFKQNLLNYYKLGSKEKSEHLEKIGKDFYRDSLENARGWLEISKERDEECEKHIRDTWPDEKQAELWKWSEKELEKKFKK